MHQSALGEAVGMARTTIANIEAGRHPVRADLLWRIAAVLDVEPQTLMPSRKAS
jgi:transcriptional regulator with XRE-family HTH domain